MEIRIYMTFDELVDAQKQFSELAGHFLLKGEVIFYILIQNILTPKKNFQTCRYLIILQHVACA